MAQKVPPANDFEDSSTRFASADRASMRAFPQRYRLRSYTLADGPKAGEVVEYLEPAIGADVFAATEVNLDLANDEVMAGNTSDGGTTRALAKGDASGRFSITEENGQNIALGATTDAAVHGDNTASLNARIRGRAITEGTQGDAAVTDSTTSNTKMSYLKGIVKMFADAWVDAKNAIRITQETHDDLNLNANLQQNNLDVATGNAVFVQPGTGANFTVSATNLDVRDLSSAQDTVGAVQSGTWTVQQGTPPWQTVGNVAHDAADSGNPEKIGAKAVNHGTAPTPVSAADRTDLYANRHGILFQIGGHPNVVTLRKNVTDADGALTNTDVIAAAGANTRIILTQVSVAVDEACTVGVGVRIGFGATTPTTTGVVASHPGIVPGGGMIRGDGSGILGISAANEALKVTADDPVGGSYDILVSYYTIVEA